MTLRALLLSCALTSALVGCKKAPTSAPAEAPSPKAAACEAGDRGACAGLEVELEGRCLGGAAAACRQLAVFHLAGRGGQVDKARAIALYEKACAARDGESCREAAGMLRETPRAEQLLQQGCDFGDGFSCSELVADLRTAARDAPRADAAFRRAVEIFDGGCHKGDPEACMGAGHMRASFAPPDEAKAAEMFGRAVPIYTERCNKEDAAACFRLALAYHEGRGVPTDFGQHTAFMERACRLGYLDACAEEAAAYKLTDTRDDDAKAPALFERACLAGVQRRQPCREAGFLYADGDAVPADKPKGVALLERACALGEVSSCFRAGAMYREGEGIPADATKAAALMDPHMNGLDVRILSATRAKWADDPTALQVGVSPHDMPPIVANPGEELAVLKFDVKRSAPKAQLPIRKVWVVDGKGERYASTLSSDFAFGQSAAYEREMVFRMPQGTKPVKVRFELGAVEMPLPALKDDTKKPVRKFEPEQHQH